MGRELLVRRYVSVYRHLRDLRPADEAVVRRWEVVRAAARFMEGIAEEEPALTRFLERATATR
jgi:hypothetical protein